MSRAKCADLQAEARQGAILIRALLHAFSVQNPSGSQPRAALRWPWAGFRQAFSLTAANTRLVPAERRLVGSCAPRWRGANQLTTRRQRKCHTPFAYDADAVSVALAQHVERQQQIH